MKRPKFIFVGGINGSGKTTLLQMAKEKDEKISYLSGSFLFMNWLGIKNRNYRTLQEMPDNFIKNKLGRMMRHIVRNKKFRKKIKIILIDAHFINIRNGESRAWIGDWMSVMDGVVLVCGTPSEISKRINFDESTKKKKRNLFTANIQKKERVKLFKKFNQDSER
ncbi:MAG: AAA family ATPase, partial [Syntrophales bacterium]|nr:AAA family ATPase [Syntrophales bacterium]